MGRRPQAPGKSDQRNTQNPWKYAEGEGWQHGRRPAPPKGLTDAGKKAWQTWLGSWWACFYTPDDLPGLELCVRTYDAAISGHIDVSKAVPLMDRYGITPEGRFKLRWTQAPAPAKAGPVKVPDEITARREARREKLA